MCHPVKFIIFAGTGTKAEGTSARTCRVRFRGDATSRTLWQHDNLHDNKPTLNNFHIIIFVYGGIDRPPLPFANVNLNLLKYLIDMIKGY